MTPAHLMLGTKTFEMNDETTDGTKTGEFGGGKKRKVCLHKVENLHCAKDKTR